jgi:aldehyde dehydrogenase (NAD+)
VEIYKHFVDGVDFVGEADEMPTIDPYEEREWAQIAVAGESAVDAAVAAARRALPAWKSLPGVARGKVLTAIADQMERDAAELAAVETRDNGKLLRENLNQIGFAVRVLRYYAGWADKIGGETKPQDNPEAFAFTTREPYGVAVLITSWNSPLNLLINKLSVALATGNCVVVKPSEHASASTLHFARTIAKAGVPAGVVNILGGGPKTGELLTSHPDVNKISFTGGIVAARLIAANAAQNVVPLTLELGGKSANIVFGDADLDLAVPGIVSGIFAAGGQSCVAGSRVLVHDSIYDRVIEAVKNRAESIVLGDPRVAETQMGPLAFGAQLNRVLEVVGQAGGEGARLVTGGVRPESTPTGFFLSPTIFADVDNRSYIAQNEIFGPVLSILRFSDQDEAVRIANDTPFGLAAGVWTKDVTVAHRVARQLRAGTVWVNTYRTNTAQTPSGGFGLSGYGRERGHEAILDYTTTKSTMIDLSGKARDPFVLGTGQ